MSVFLSFLGIEGWKIFCKGESVDFCRLLFLNTTAYLLEESYHKMYAIRLGLIVPLDNFYRVYILRMFFFLVSGFGY